MMIDTSTEAVERLAKHIKSTCGCALGSDAEQPVAETLHSLLKERDEARAALAARPPADLDLSQPAPNPRPEGLCEIHPLCKGMNE